MSTMLLSIPVYASRVFRPVSFNFPISFALAVLIAVQCVMFTACAQSPAQIAARILAAVESVLPAIEQNLPPAIATYIQAADGFAKDLVAALANGIPTDISSILDWIAQLSPVINNIMAFVLTAGGVSPGIAATVSAALGLVNILLHELADLLKSSQTPTGVRKAADASAFVQAFKKEKTWGHYYQRPSKGTVQFFDVHPELLKGRKIVGQAWLIRNVCGSMPRLGAFGFMTGMDRRVCVQLPRG